MISCGATSEERIALAARTTAEAPLVSQALAACTPPPLPDDCRKTEDVDVTLGERLDVFAARAYWNLEAANNRIARCAQWHDDIAAAKK